MNSRLIDVLEPLALTHATTAPGDTATAFLSALAVAAKASSRRSRRVARRRLEPLAASFAASMLSARVVTPQGLGIKPYKVG